MTDTELENVISWLRDRAQCIIARSIGDDVSRGTANALLEMSTVFQQLQWKREYEQREAENRMRELLAKRRESGEEEK